MANLRRFQREVKRTVARAERQEFRGVLDVERDEAQASNQVAKFMPREIKALFVGGNYDAALAGLKESIEAGDPWALMAWLKAAGVIEQPTHQVVQNLFAQLNVSGDQELAELAESGRRMRQLRDEGVTLDAMRDEAVEALKLVLRERPDWRAQVHAELCAGSNAEVLDSAGHAIPTATDADDSGGSHEDR